MGYRLKNLDGTTTNIDIRPSQYPMRSEGECKSRAQYRFGQRLKVVFPYSIVLEEFSIPDSGGLSLDFWLPEDGFAFEIQGGQHRKFSKFHHGDVMGFQAQRVRDRRKKAWCDLNNIQLIAVDDKDVDSADIVSLLDEQEKG